MRRKPDAAREHAKRAGSWRDDAIDTALVGNTRAGRRVGAVQQLDDDPGNRRAGSGDDPAHRLRVRRTAREAREQCKQREDALQHAVIPWARA